MTAGVDAALSHLESHWDELVEELKSFARIAGISAEPPPSLPVQQSAEFTARMLTRAGLENVEVIEFPGGHPYVYGDWLHAPEAPTVLLYGHHDVQPPGRASSWKSPPFEPTLREDGRLYARGVVDDKAGVMMHVAACSAFLRTSGKLPLNVKFIVEGEEEAGSHTLQAFLQAHQQRLAADVIVLSDTANLEAGLPSLTCSLRGIAAVRVQVKALKQPLHSGMWGGPVPDPVIALCRAIGRLTDEDGKVSSAFWRNVRPLEPNERSAVESLPFDERQFREQAGLQPTAQLTGNQDSAVWTRMWREPAVSVIAFEARPFAGSSNQIIDSARARISMRIVPDQDPIEVQNALVRHFETAVPWGLEVSVQREDASGWWLTTPRGPAFDAAKTALAKGYGVPAVEIGCGGSIPFVDPFAKVLGGAPALLLGLEDPTCAAHSENESLNVEDWKRGTRAAVYLYEELSRTPGIRR